MVSINFEVEFRCIQRCHLISDFVRISTIPMLLSSDGRSFLDHNDCFRSFRANASHWQCFQGCPTIQTYTRRSSSVDSQILVFDETSSEYVGQSNPVVPGTVPHQL